MRGGSQYPCGSPGFLFWEGEVDWEGRLNEVMQSRGRQSARNVGRTCASPERASFLSRVRVQATLDCPLLRSRANTWRWSAQKHSFDTEIFVNIGPVKTHAWTENFPILSLLRSCVRKSGIPSDWYREAAPVSQRDDEIVFSNYKPNGQRFTYSFQGAHAISPNIGQRSHEQCREARSVHDQQSHATTPRRPVAART